MSNEQTLSFLVSGVSSKPPPGFPSVHITSPIFSLCEASLPSHLDIKSNDKILDQCIKLSSQSPSPKSSSKVKSKVKSKVRSLKSWVQDLDFAYSIITTPPPPTTTTLNFSDTSRGPTTKCYTFLETSHEVLKNWCVEELMCWRIEVLKNLKWRIWNDEKSKSRKVQVQSQVQKSSPKSGVERT